MIQMRRSEGKMQDSSLDLSHAHLEWLELIVMAWIALSSKMVQMERPRVTLYAYKTALHPTSWKRSLTAKDAMTSGSSRKAMLSTLTSVRCVKIISMGFFRRGWIKKLYMYSMKSSEFPRNPMKISDRNKNSEIRSLENIILRKSSVFWLGKADQANINAWCCEVRISGPGGWIQGSTDEHKEMVVKCTPCSPGSEPALPWTGFHYFWEPESRKVRVNELIWKHTTY